MVHGPHNSSFYARLSIMPIVHDPDPVRAALIELVRLKDLKARDPEQYESEGRAKVWAWDQARLALLGPYDYESEPCDYCRQKGRDWTPDCEENK